MLNSVIIMGRLTADPELRQTNNAVDTTSFTVAVDRGYAKAGEEKQADFINCVAWRQTAVFITKYFHKGSMIAIQGKIQTRKYEDKEGKKRTATEIIVDNASFCGGKKDEDAVGYSAPAPSTAYPTMGSPDAPAGSSLDAVVDADGDNLPF